jgi:hypothetical protein
MNKLGTLFIFCLSLLHSQSLFVEHFTYGTRDSLDGIGGWLNAGTNTVNNIKIVSPGLTFVGYPGSEIGNSLYLSNAGTGDVNSQLFSKRDTGTVYLSYMLKVDSLGSTATQGFVITLDQWGGTTNLSLRGYIQKVNKSSFKLGVEKAAGGLVYAPKVYNTGTTYVVVLKYTFVPNSTTNDSAKIFVLSPGSSMTEPVKPDTFTVGGTDNSDLGEILLINSYFSTGLKDSPIRIDGIKIGTTWANSVLQPVQLYFKEDFNFNAGDSLRGKNGWDIYTGGAPMLVSNSTLSFTGYAGSQIGKSLGITGGGELQTPYRAFNHLGTGSLYYSFLVMLSGSNAEGGYFTGLTDGTGGSFRGLVYAKIVSGTVSFGAQATLNGTVVYDTVKYSANKIYLVVLKYRYVDGANNDEVSLYVHENTLPAQEPSKPNVGPLLTPNELVPIGAVTVMSGALTAGTALKGATIVLDGLRVSSTWANGVTAVKNTASESVPNGFELLQNYPNPFNPVTTIAYRVAESGPASIKVRDLLGKEVATLVDGHHAAGNYSVRLNGSHLSSGCYFYTLTSGGKIMTKKLLLMK